MGSQEALMPVEGSTGLVQQDQDLSATSLGSAESRVQPDWTAPPAELPMNENYAQVAEDMSIYLTQSGFEPSFWWDPNM